MPILNLSDAAKDDLYEIWKYVADDNIVEADRLIDTIKRRYSRLETFPNMGHSREELGTGLRTITSGAYVIFYTVENDNVEIARIIHGARDLDELFDSES
jgi:toxin ParE1/3/4